jgi:hypothetical protein
MILVDMVLTMAVLAATVQPQGFDSNSVAATIRQASPGDTIQLAAGTYELDEPIRPRSKIRLIGAGQEKTILVYRGTKASSLVSLADCEDVELAHLTLDGRGNPLIHQGISGGNSRRLWLHHLTIRNLANAKTWGPHAILFSGQNPTMAGGVTDSRITDCRIENIGVGAAFGGGIRMAWGSARNQVIGNTIDKTGRGGIFGDHSAELVIRDNRVSGSGGEGLAIEIWGGCPRSLIEDNVVDHWISNDSGNQSAVRRNVVGADDGTLKGYGIEIIARDCAVTDNVVNRGAGIGLSVSNRPVKNNVFWGYNTVRDCVQWGAQLQSDSGGIARHYFYRCTFEKTVRGDPRARYKDSGHGFRTNGGCQGMVFEECTFRGNGGYGVQLGGRDVDKLTFLRSAITDNGLAAVTGPAKYTALQFIECKVAGNGSNQLPEGKPAARGGKGEKGRRGEGEEGRGGDATPVADFRVPGVIRTGEPALFQCMSRVSSGEIVERLWDFGDGIPEVAASPSHTFHKPGKYRVTLIVWDAAGRGGRAERWIEVK